MSLDRQYSIPAFVLSNDHVRNPRFYYAEAAGLNVVRSLGRKGIPVIRLHPNAKDSAVSSRYCCFVRCPDTSRPDELKGFLLQLRGRYDHAPVLFPSTDEAALFVARHEEALRDHFRIPMPGREVVELIVDKKKQYDAALSLGIPIPKTFYPHDLEELKDIGARMTYPCIIKPVASYFWRRDYVKEKLNIFKVKKVGSFQELAECCRMFFSVSKDIMIQEIIPGEEKNLITFIMYCDRNAEPVAYCTRRKLRQNPPGFGDVTFTDSCRVPEVIDMSVRFLKGIGFKGLGGVEFKFDPRDGKFKLVEINTRTLHTGSIAPACGVDLPFIAYEDMTGEKISPVISFQEGVKWVEFLPDVTVAKTLVREGNLTWGGWFRSLQGRTVDSVFAWDDPLPFVKLVCSSFIKRIMKFFLRE